MVLHVSIGRSGILHCAIGVVSCNLGRHGEVCIAATLQPVKEGVESRRGSVYKDLRAELCEFVASEG